MDQIRVLYKNEDRGGYAPRWEEVDPLSADVYAPQYSGNFRQLIHDHVARSHQLGSYLVVVVKHNTGEFQAYQYEASTIEPIWEVQPA